MSPRAFQFLLWTTLVAIAAAIFIVRGDERPQSAQISGARAAPFGSRGGDVARIVIDAPDYALTLEKLGQAWVASDRGSYPARPSAIANLMSSLASLKLSDRKTGKPELFAGIGVEDRKPGATSTSLAFTYADGSSAGGLIVGKRSNAASFDQAGATFVRRIGEPQAWLAQGAVSLPRDFSEYFIELPAIPATEVNGVAITEAGKLVFEARKNAEGLYSRADANEPAANDTAVKRVAQALVGVGFEDVRPAAAMTSVKRNIRLALAEGKYIDVILGEGDGKPLVRFEGDSAGPAGEVIKLSKGFAYRLPGYRLGGLTQSLAELTAEEPPAAPQGMPPHGGFPGGFPGGLPGGMPQGLPPGFSPGMLPPGGPR